MKKLFFIIIFTYLILIVLSIHCVVDPDDNSNNNNTSTTYPTKLYPLSDQALIALQAEFDTLKGDINSELDEYGLIDYAGLLDRGNSTIENADVAVEKSKSKLLELGKFSNVSDTSLLEIKEATNQHGTSLFDDWIVTFENQKYQDLEVLDTEIMVLLGDEVKQISGHHYQDIYIPAKDETDTTAIKELLTGYQIHFICWVETIYEITEESILIDQIEKVIYPKKNPDSIEFRVAWKVPIGESPEYPSWHAYIDVISGEIIEIEQLFIC